MVTVDYSSRVVPEVKVNIDTPYYKGEVLALCVEKPLVGLVIGIYRVFGNEIIRT